MAENKPKGLSAEDRDKADKRTGIRSPLIYEAVRQEGNEELKRPLSSLAWSGFAAGLALSFSIYGKAFIASALSGVAWGSLASHAGYSVGFVIVIIGRLQLFTENTITAVLPLLAHFSKKQLVCLLRLWLVVFATNMAGSLASAICALKVPLFPEFQVQSILATSRELLGYTAYESMAFGIPAGFLVAAIVWVLPAARTSAFWIVVSLSFIISAGGMTHVVAGSTEWFLLSLSGELSWIDCWMKGILPALIGNIIGGTGLFALISYGQVREEL